MKTIERTLTNNCGESIVIKMTVIGHKVGLPGSVAHNRRTIRIVESTAPVEIEVIDLVNGQQVDALSIEQTSGDAKRMVTYPVRVFANGDRTRNGAFKIFDFDGL